MRAFHVVFRHAFRQLFTGRRLAVSVLLGGLPVMLAAAVIGVRRSLGLATLSPLAFYNDFVPAYFHTWAILASILFASSAVSDDEEDGSVVYLLIRPIRRGLIYLGKVAAAAAASLLVLLTPLVLTASVLLLGAGSASRPSLLTIGKDLGWLAIAAIAYPAAFAALSAIGRRPLHLAAAYLFLWEVPMAFAPTALRYLTVSHYLLSLMPHTRFWNAAVATLQMETTPLAAMTGLAALSVLFLAAGSMRYERKEHVQGSGV